MYSFIAITRVLSRLGIMCNCACSMLRGISVITNFITRSTSILDVHPDVVTPPIIGPAMKLDQHLLKWAGEGGGSSVSLGNGGLSLRIIFDTGIQEPSLSHVNMENCGTVAIYYSWKVCRPLCDWFVTYCCMIQKVPKPNPLGTRLAGRIQRFYFDSRDGINDFESFQ